MTASVINPVIRGVINDVIQSDEFIFSADDPKVLAWYDDNRVSNTLFDESPNSNDATITGATTITGHIGDALAHDGVNDQTSMPGGLGPSIKAVAAWFRTDGTSSYFILNSAADPFIGDGSFATLLLLTSGKFTLDHNIFGGGAQTNLQTVSTFAFNTWHLGIMQQNAAGNGIEMFVNDQSESFTTVIGTDTGQFFNTTTTNTLNMGARGVSDSPIFRKGDNDQLIISSERFTAEERASIWNNGTGRPA
jgi:hypothetical protein